MEDDDLSRYLVSYGDRVAVRAFSKVRVHAAGKGKDSVLSRIKDKLMQGKAGSSNRRLGNLNAKKDDKNVEVGWLNYDEKSTQYHQVRSKSGGGVRHIRFLKTANISAVKEKAINLFFPGGHSKKGPIENFEVDIRDFCHQTIPDTKTITEFLEETKVKVCRLYLGTKMKEDVSLCDSSQTKRESSQHADAKEPENEMYSTDDLISLQAAIINSVDEQSFDDLGVDDSNLDSEISFHPLAASTYILDDTTVLPLLRGHPFCRAKVASQEGWPLVRGRPKDEKE